jgi:hypothetical protein
MHSEHWSASGLPPPAPPTWGGRTPFSSPAFTCKKRPRECGASSSDLAGVLIQQNVQQQHLLTCDTTAQPSKRVDRTPRSSLLVLPPPPQASSWFAAHPPDVMMHTSDHQHAQQQQQHQHQQQTNFHDTPGEWSTFAQELAECARSMQQQQQRQQQGGAATAAAAAAAAQERWLSAPHAMAAAAAAMAHAQCGDDAMVMDDGGGGGDVGEEDEGALDGDAGTLLLFGAPS